MLSLAFATMRGRMSSLAGSFLALLFAAVLVTACGVLMETGLRAQVRPERYGAVPVVLAGPQQTSIVKKGDEPIEVTESVPLEEPASIPASLAGEIRRVPGVRDVVTELTFPVGLLGSDGRMVQGPTSGHAWESARLTPYTLRAGHVPASPGEIVLDAALAEKARLTGKEALLIGAVASAAGVLPGVAVGRWMFGELVSKGMLPDLFPPVVGPVPMLVAVAAGTATAWLSARGAVRRATRIRPTEALGEAVTERRALGRGRVITGLVFLALGAGLCVVSMFVAGETAAMSAGGIVLFLAVAAALLGPWLVRLAVTLVGGALGRSSRVGGYLAVANTRTGAQRLAAVVSPLILMLAFAGTTVFTQSTIGHATARQAADGLRADYVVRSAGPGVPSDVSRSARALPGVAGVTEVIDTRVVGDLEELGERTLRPYGAIGLTVPAHGLDLDVQAGSLDRLRGDTGDTGGAGGSAGSSTGGTVALSTLAADSFGVSVGDKVRLRLGDGTPITPTVVAVYGRGLGFGDVALPYDLVRAHTASGMADRLLVVGDGSIRNGLAELSPGLTVLDRDDASDVRDAELELNNWVNLLALGLIIVFIAVSVINTLVMATTGRVREFALLRLVGGTRRQVLGVIRWEALLVGGIALAAGTAIAVPTLMAISYGLTGSAIPHVRPVALAAMVAATLGLALAATLIPARAVLAGRPADHIRG
ncbi:FtsX-like permease family protein [Microtetraspora sp. NBRC 16547]|uniref:ABC transporter permease n=1 Tax=Microtetraspora sp. NBRC 16547 TaxID=3030993 RepID=UPI0024A0F00E|nr:FtsX-like permease family protein [Microtetraspora sp. NBRC 16547]GLX00488.1 hypothetical protein Misp02_45740 [Microtetraspora sp. NBRC 16547]